MHNHSCHCVFDHFEGTKENRLRRDYKAKQFLSRELPW